MPHYRPRLALFLVVSVVAGCGSSTGGAAPDASDTPTALFCGGSSASREVHVGKTGVDFEPFAAGEVLPAWSRPQGGVGTRINVKLAGFAEDAPFAALTTRLSLAARSGGGLDGEGELCAGDDACAAGLGCHLGACRLLICEQAVSVFPFGCLADGSLHVSEMPVRFFDDQGLDELDGQRATLEVEVALDDGGIYRDAVDVVLEAGPFVAPTWWGESPASPPSPPPEGWSCDPRWWGEGWCDCGCGVVDEDCADLGLDACFFNACRGDMRPDAFDPLQCEANYFTCNPHQIQAWQLPRRHPLPIPREEKEPLP